MQTIFRNGKLYHEFTPQEVEAARLEREINRMARTGRYRSTHGAVDAALFIADTGHRTHRHKAH